MRFFAAHSRLHCLDGTVIKHTGLADNLLDRAVNLFKMCMDAADLSLDSGFSICYFINVAEATFYSRTDGASFWSFMFPTLDAETGVSMRISTLSWLGI